MSNYRNFINEINQVIPLLEGDLVDNTIDEETREDLADMLFSYILKRTIALYSSKADKEAVTQSLLKAIEAFENGFKWEGFEKSYGMYDQIIWILSLAILCEINDDDLQRIVAIIQRDNAKDRLIKTLVNYRLPNEIDESSTNYIQKSPYAALDLLVIGSRKDTGFIKNYLDKKWYQGHTDTPWHDSHKNTKVNTFFGYWSWETAALIKIYNINDHSLKNQQYYPYRAVHW